MTSKTITHTIIQALPGWYVALFIEGGEGYEDYFDLNPIIAWEIERREGPYDHRLKRDSSERWVHHHASPITLEGNTENIGNRWAIKRPDGVYDIPEDATFSEEAKAIKHLRLQIDRDREEARSLKAAREKELPLDTDGSVSLRDGLPQGL